MKILSIASARPNFVKLAAVHHALKDRKGIEHVVIHTGQHYDPLFSDVFFEQLSIPLPVKNLGVVGGMREEVIDRTMLALGNALSELKPDIVLVYGDVNGAVGAAKAAQAAGITLAHIEAGLRSFDTSMPEELNRIAIDQIADVLFCTEQSGVDHLKNERVHGAAHLVGNTMIDTLVRMLPLIEQAQVPEQPTGRYAVVTLHRPSNVDRKEDLQKSILFLEEISASIPLIFPLHHRTKASLGKFTLALPQNVTACAPLGYLQFLKLAQHASFIFTDSGGIQEEATYLRKRCFTLRKNTERPSTIASGSNVLIDLDDANNRKQVLDFAKHPIDPTVNIPALWDGCAGERIIDIIALR